METASERAIASIYSALLGEIGWQDVVDHVAKATGADMATLFYHDTTSGHGAITLASGISEAIQRDYASHFVRLNPWMARVSETPIGRGIVGEEIVARNSLLRSEYYNDFLQRHDQETGVGVTVRRDNGCFLLFSVLSGDADVERNQARADYLTRVAPHLRRAADFYARQSAMQLGGIAGELSGASGIATIVVNMAARVVSASPLGEALLAAGDIVGIDAAGFVSLDDTLAQSMFSHALRGRYPDILTNTVQVGDSEITFVRVLEDHGSQIFMGGTLALLIRRHAAVEGGVARIATRFRLTPAEKRVLDGIVSGRRPKEIAAETGVALETVRSQLKTIYGKTGTNRQAELVRLAAGLLDTVDARHGRARYGF